MFWLNLHVSTLREPEFVAARPIQRSTWISVLLLSVELENGGILAGALEWTDRQWQQTCGVTRREVHACAPLLRFVGADLIVWNYPAHKQKEIALRREAGRKGGLQSGLSRRPDAPSTPQAVLHDFDPAASSTPSSSASSSSPSTNPSNPGTERKGKERNEKGKESYAAGSTASETFSDQAIRESSRTLPPNLDTPAFREAWAVWFDYLESLKPGRPIPSQTLDAHLARILPLGPAAAIEAVHNAIAKRFAVPVPPFAKNLEGGGAPAAEAKLYDPANPDNTFRDVTAEAAAPAN